MSAGTPARLAGFAAIVAAVFGIALVAGRVFGPIDEGGQKAGHDTHAADGGEESSGMEGMDMTPAASIPGGLMTSQDGYSLVLEQPQVKVKAGAAAPISFTITGPDGEPVTAYDVEHEKRLHLIAVRRDFTGFQHVHPTLDDGTWSTDLALTPGSWRIFADFKATGAEALTLGTDLAVDGDFTAAAPAQETRTATVDGYRVTLDGDLTAGSDAKLTVSVSKDGERVTDLQPYLGAYGHLVALRGGDLAYLHVHPDGEPGDGKTEPGPEVVFYATVPSAGTYHLYLDFQHDGVVRTAAFTVTAGGEGSAAPADEGGHDDKDSDKDSEEESGGHAH